MQVTKSNCEKGYLLSFGATILTHLLPHCPFLPLFPYMLGLRFIALTFDGRTFCFIVSLIFAMNFGILKRLCVACT